MRPGSIVLDAGCGNGKYLGFNPDCLFIGCDISLSLIEICAGRGHEVLVADAVNLPYRDDFGDAAISIAVLHHLSTDDRRRKAIEELIRVVRRGGLVLITVWAIGSRKTSHCLTSGLPSVRNIMKSGLNRAVLQYVVNLELFWKALQKLMKTLV